MELRAPFEISSRLLPSLRVGGATIGIEYAKRQGERTRYQWTIDLPDGTSHTGDDLQSGVGGGSLQQGMESLLAFLGACAESFAYSERTGREGENADLFPRPVAEWAAQYSDELSALAYELEETKGLIAE